MRIAHVVERNAPTGQAWRLAAAIGKTRWLDLEVARRRLVRLDPELAHDEAVARQPITTLDDHLASRFRVADLRMLVAPWPLDEAGLDALDAEDDDLLLRGADLRFGPPVLAPRSLRDFYAFEGHVRTIWARRGQEIPEVWHRLPIFYFSNVSEIRGPGEPVWAPRGSIELDFELEVAALVDVRARDLDAGHAEEAIGGYMILNDWSARDLQREETTVRLGPAKGKDFASTIGPWLVTPDELADLRTAGAAGPDLEMTATVNGVEISRGRWCDARFSFGQMLERASADATVVPGDLVGSGTVGTGCLLEVRDSTLGRYLLPGDDVVLHIDRLGELRTPIIERLERPR